MKKHIILGIIALVWGGMLFAAPRSEQEALQEATKYFSARQTVRRNAPIAPQALSLKWTALQANQEPAFYVFNRGENGGFVIISAEDRTRTVLGYTDSGTFDEASMPDNMRTWVNRYIRDIHYAATLPAEQAEALRRNAIQASYTPIDAICKTTWNQGDPYNAKCPYDGDSRSVTGCVATAAAQVMKVHNYPTKGTGSHSYEWNGQTLSANFGNTTYNWSSMINDYWSSSSTMTQKNAVATLMYHCGVACEMNYGANGSGANGHRMMNALVEYFGYDPAIRVVLKDYMSEKRFMDAIIADLQVGRPVYFTAVTPNNEGHAFVCDGLDSDGLVHINWGWGGACDGYFLVSVLNPDEQGIGGSANNSSYTENVTAFTQIQPNADGKPVYTITADEMEIQSKRFSRSTKPKFTAYSFMNNSAHSWSGSLMLLVYQNGSLVKTISCGSGYALDPGYYYTSGISISGSLSSLAAGEYELAPGVSADDQSGTYFPIYVKGIGEYRCPMTVTSSEIILEEPSDEPDVVDIEVTEGVLFNDSVAKYGWWQIRAENDSYYVTLSNNYTTQISGTYAVADLDPDYSYVQELANNNKVSLIEGSVTLTEDSRTGGVEAEGSFTGSDGKTYNLHFIYGELQPDPTVPLVSELAQEYDVENKIVVALKFDEQVCNDLVFAGTYNSWNIANPANMLHFKPVNGYQGWYAVEVPYASDAAGKPIQLDGDGNASWEYQSGDVNAWIHKGGKKANVVSGYAGESDVYYPSTGAYIYEVAYFKLHNSPCVPEPMTIEINTFDSVHFINQVAGYGWWQIQAFNETYYVTLSNNYTTQTPGTYDIADLDTAYSYVYEYETDKKIAFTAGSVTLTVDEKTNAVTAIGSFTGSDGNFYNLHIVYGTPSGPSYTVIYLDKDKAQLASEEVELHVPDAPVVPNFTFVCWQPIASDIANGIFIQAIYEYNGNPQSAPAEVEVPDHSGRKLIREGHVYILRDDRTYTIQGARVKDQRR